MTIKTPPEELDAWTEEVELLLAEWSEKATCFRWLYNKSETKYRTRYYLMSIPVIVLSTLTGACNVGLNNYIPEESHKLAQAVVGFVNIFAGIISTLQNFLKVAEKMEGSRLASISWSKLGRQISIELAIDPKRRTPAHDFLSICRAEYDRLIEQSPTIDEDIINTFKKRFTDYKDISRPAITNGLSKVNIFNRDSLQSNIKLDLDTIENETEEIISP